MIERLASRTLSHLARGFPVLAITGPRQSGKTTLARMAFPDKPYVSLEDPDVHTLAARDPRRFLAGFPDGAILDEAQRLPDLFSWLQGLADARGRRGDFILTGSQQFSLMSRITQSLAGRVGLVQLPPLTLAESGADGVDAALWRGGYPVLQSPPPEPQQWFPSYVATYVERDVRQLLEIRDLSRFRHFVAMCAARTGQLLNLSSLAADCGISHVTAREWLTVLEASYIVFLLRPYHRNFGKRLVKAPKLYFLDTGLAAWLLGIRGVGDIAIHALRGALFETLVVGEFLKHRWIAGQPADLYFWRDSAGHEVDLLFETGGKLQAVEIKSGMTFASDWLDGTRRWRDFAGRETHDPWIIHGGDQTFDTGGSRAFSWRSLMERPIV
ncbi:MAG: ATP-binding protein [Rhodocyclaceae bacterium]|nr:ATP-binding protein [Rhodocyclaceae bacterium]